MAIADVLTLVSVKSYLLPYERETSRPLEDADLVLHDFPDRHRVIRIPLAHAFLTVRWQRHLRRQMDEGGSK